MSDKKTDKETDEENGASLVLTEKEDGDPEEETTVIDIIFEWANAFIIGVIFVVFLMTFVFRQVTVDGTSMTDTLQDGDKLIISNFMYKPQYGDIVVISHGENYGEPIIKRVIATEGQALSIDYETGTVSVDGVILDEDYIKGMTVELKRPTEIPDRIPKGYVFVMGDNRQGSLDSRSTDIGLIPVENIIGKAEFRYYPFDSIGSVY